MTPFQLYKLYLAIRLHFNTVKYDAIASGGRVKCSEDSFKNRPNISAVFYILSKKIKEPRDAVQFFVANELYSTSTFEYDEAQESYKKWIKHREMMTQLILDDIDKIVKDGIELDDAFTGEIPLAIKMLNRGEIHIETLVAINSFIRFSEWSNWKENLCFPTLVLKLNKAIKFVRFNEEKVKRKIEYECSKICSP